MSQPERFEILVLGSGEGGKYLAWHMAKAGRRTAVVERRYVGGSCPNINCLPSKNEVWSAKVADLLHHAAKFGSSPSRLSSTTFISENSRSTLSGTASADCTRRDVSM